MATKSHVRKFFFRGLGILLPTILTAWLLYYAYSFVEQRIADPINDGIRSLIVTFSDWPEATSDDYNSEIVLDYLDTSKLKNRWANKRLELAQTYKNQQQELSPAVEKVLYEQWTKEQPDIVILARENAIGRWWNTIKIGRFNVLNLIGLVVAVIIIYFIGVVLSGFIGRRLYSKGEQFIDRVPIIRRIYPSVKQVTDFFFSEDQDPKSRFSRVVAVEYPRKGLWSVGLVTGSTMLTIEQRAGQKCLTVFIPSSPTPFTGYVITIAENDTIDLDITIEDALKFAVSLGVLVPPSQDSLKNTQSFDTNKLDVPNDDEIDDKSTTK
ncbi:hypothetical protein KS4_09430 [Poriferisphaera corsica]|uniref:DUF502 domain-containing protein n=1 Tax=Poriferisphaera corsica TaxID=2528020 RepID=A0A517YRQ2_9BACT|nr:DUF502 domain-containing protein [Poriferisphaera corsica]QDU32904.1 hypothetical protein KS4_09430 [Poriferisphaera corsica]